MKVENQQFSLILRPFLQIKNEKKIEKKIALYLEILRYIT